MLNERKEDAFIGTVSGRVFHPFNPQAEEVSMSDIIHSLSNKTRWNGHITHRYTVAQHSVEVMKYVENYGGSPLEQFYGLMHDTVEAYCVDMPTPIKEHLPEFLDMEQGIWNAIAEAHHIDPELPRIVKEADKWQIYREAASFFYTIPDWMLGLGDDLILEAKDDRIYPEEVWDYNTCVTQFRNHYNRLVPHATGDIR